jgi:hypothetical protein
MRYLANQPQQRFVIPSTPGGSACQFRVQQRTPDGQWHCHGSFHDRAAAQLCLADLQLQGFEVRLVSMRICPVAA